MFNTAGRLKSASGLYCVKFFISLAHAKQCVAFCQHFVSSERTSRLPACSSSCWGDLFKKA